MKLSLLDRSRTRVGAPDADALEATVARAKHAEQAGYERYWVAEHHAVPGIASGAPAVLLAAIGAQTSRIRIGSGGVMLPLHQPLVVAEQFLVLEALFPGRVDLGLGRSLGFTAPVRRALRRELDAAESFDADLAELRGYLEGTADITVRPAARRPLPLHLLATGRGIDTAARLGLPVVVGGPVLDSDELPDLLGRYRRDFRPHRGSTAWVTISLDILVADDDATARELALPEAWAMALSRQTGEFPPLEPVAAVHGAPSSAQVRRRVEASLDRAVAGSPTTVRRRLERLAERTGADEVLSSASTYDRDAVLASDRSLRELVA
ncbi:MULTISPECIES: MsnO8 family LLM class oxidoreductase [unclassified Nocardioides]|uniref:MsnO8 family LLM class oxidoreductase n=1 Tax=unclassified Nocardioides TaxID=2615069 RepID=UPI0009F019CB|nr:MULTISPECIES: MsnO8 family LLM class oxidoreductase [unclassified Nocardioides]GAW51130.1 luciferase family oxidoreductase, group 1 [Nocardioides sp. PD653-B2]GAW57529.1 luciferase family oxidoreductase, group 1 [Nocardioides sp. PD653]